MIDLAVNAVTVELATGDKYRVLWKVPNNSYGYRIRLDDKTRMPEKFIASSNEEYEAIEDEGMATFVDESSIPDNKKKHRDRIWSILSDALTKEPEIYDKKSRRKILLEIQNQTGMSVSNIYPYLTKYWKKGKTKNAFIPEFSKRGPRGAIKNPSKKAGKPSKKSVFGKVLSDNDKINFAKSIQKYYLNKNEYTFQAVYELLLRDFYSTKIPGDNGSEKLQLLPSNEIPSIKQFYYWYSKQKDVVRETRKRKGDGKFELSGRSVLGKSDYGVMGPGSKYQVDATVGDIYLVSQFNHSRIIGRPVMYFVIDVFSRMVTGMYIGLEGPSWLGMMMAIANAASDKVKYCAEYGINIKNDEWPCNHVPAAILGDRGELISKNADNLVSILGIRIENAPPYRADLKGIIEQHFRTINTNATMFLPGRVKPDARERGGKDYRLDAKLNIRQFTQIIIKCVLFYNNHHYMDYLEKSEQMISDDVEAIPINLWEWGIQNRSGILRSFPEASIKLALMPTSKGSVTSKGIHFKGIYYTCDRAADEQWFEKARSNKSWKIDIHYDPRDMSHIYIRNQPDGSFELCRLLDWGGKYAGKYLDEILFELEKEKYERKRLRSKEFEAKINLKQEIDAVILEAESSHVLSTNTSKAGQLSGIRDNRRLEKQNIRKHESFTNDTSDDDSKDVLVNVDTALPDEDEISPVLQMIKRKLEERLNTSE